MTGEQFIHIDGSAGEGGGQILRTSLALACITGRTLRIDNIRARRPNPGLARQHISCIKAACEVSNGVAHGAFLGSGTLEFQPGLVKGGIFSFDVGSAGSATLVAQTVLPALFLAEAPSTLAITGGTHNPLAPPFDFVNETFLPAIAKAGFRAECILERHGFYPAGGGRIVFRIQPTRKEEIHSIQMCEPPTQVELTARIYTARLPAHVASHQEKLLRRSGLNITLIEHVDVTDSAGAGNCVVTRIAGRTHTTIFSAFGMRGKPSKTVIAQAAEPAAEFLKSGAAVDPHLADQLLIYMALVGGGRFTTSRLSEHLKTNIEVIKKFLDMNFLTRPSGRAFEVSCMPR